MSKFPKSILAASAFVALSAMAASAATTPYDLIRPTWPLSWDSTEFENFDDTTGVKIIGALPKEVVPPNFKAGELMADTVDQAYLDAINQHISPIRVNQAGYLKSDKERQFYYIGNAKSFEVVDAKGKSLSKKTTGDFVATDSLSSSSWSIKAATNANTAKQSRYSIDFTSPKGTLKIGNIPQSVPTETRLRIKVGDELSSTFIVSEDVYTMVKDASIKFFGIQRSGNSESWFHGPSHTKDGAGPVVSSSTSSDAISPKAGDLQGGWYDCGDHLKESQTMAYAFMTLAVMSATNPDKDVDHYAYNQADFVNTDKVPDMLREAKHGADFFLRAYKVAKGVIDNMAVSIGAFGSDHSFWSRPEVQDGITVADRGGPAEREVRLGELGSNVSGEIAAGLAILGKNYSKYDKKFADSCLKVAEEMYDFAKNLALGNSTYGDKKTFKNNTIAAGWGTPAYMGNNEYSDDMALASVALLFATGKEEYLDDALRSTEVAKVNEARTGAGFFEGGWFASGDMNSLVKNAKNTSWANSHAFALYALYKLILSDKDQAETFGLSEEERLNAIEDCIANMIANLGDMSTAGTGKIELPEGGIGWKQNTVAYDPTWFFMLTDQSWVINRYHVANIFEVLAYADVAADIEKQGLKLPNMETSGWKASEMHQLGINQLNYLLGVNPWDVSFIYGVGDKNDNHPHHRASNPEGRNTLNFEYKYVRPVGALFGGPAPKAPYSWEPSGKSWEDYHLSEVCLDASASLISALTFVSNGGSKYYEKKCDNCSKNDPNPFATDTFYVKSYIYDWAGLDMLSLRVYNNTTNDLDSITVYLYFNATEEEALGIESTDNTIGTCNIIFDLDMCVSYDNAGFVRAASIDNDTRSQMRETHPIKLDDTYNKKDKTYIWKMPVFLGTIPSGSMFQADIGTSSGIRQKNTCETLRVPSKVDIRKGWSFAAHEAEDGKPAFDGVPVWDKEQGDVQEPPRSPYIVAERNDKRLWGYAPGDTVEVKKEDSKKDDEKESIDFAGLHSFEFGSLHVAGRTLIAQAPAQGTKTLKVFDLLGNVVMSETFNGETAQVNLANVSKRGTLVARLVMGRKVLATQAIRVK
ncbi:MAG: glycoside hydrolase family 9 protein [Fibrobacter sp.]|nr:glycoside hydrolase family 9 protein [Fibrobacter sp.]